MSKSAMLLRSAVMVLAVVHVVSYEIAFYPAVVKNIPETESSDIRVYLRNCSDSERGNAIDVNAALKVGDPEKLAFPPTLKDVSCCLNETDADCGANMTLKGITLSYNVLNLCSSDNTSACSSLTVGVIRPPEQIKDKIFIIAAMIVTVFYTLCFGAMLDLQKVKEIFKRPFGPILGMVGQFVVMPVIAYALTWTIEEDKSLEFGIFATGVTPGGGASNIWSYLLGGDLDLSITMTLLSTVGSLAFIPLWMLTLGKYMLNGTSIPLPFIGILQTLAIVVLPIAVGLLINRFLPKLAKGLYYAQKYTVGLAMVFMTAIGIWANLYAFIMVFSNYKLALIVCFYPIAGAVVGIILSVICRQNRSVSITVGIETAIQNSTVATILLRTTLVQPWGDISSAFSVCMILYTPAPLLILAIIRLTYLLVKHKGRLSEIGQDLEKEQVELRDSEKYRVKDDKDKSSGVDNPTMVTDDENSNSQKNGHANGVNISAISYREVLRN